MLKNDKWYEENNTGKGNRLCMNEWVLVIVSREWWKWHGSYRSGFEVGLCAVWISIRNCGCNLIGYNISIYLGDAVECRGYVCSSEARRLGYGFHLWHLLALSVKFLMHLLGLISFFIYEMKVILLFIW